MPLLALLAALLDTLAHDADTANPADRSARAHRLARELAGLALLLGSLAAVAVWWAQRAAAGVTVGR